MLTHFHRLSALLFYLLGTSFFVAYLLHFNKLGDTWPYWWMQVGDLPLVLCTIMYGGLSLYRSVTPDEETSVGTAVFICVPLVAVFGLLVVMNFWEVLM